MEQHDMPFNPYIHLTWSILLMTNAETAYLLSSDEYFNKNINLALYVTMVLVTIISALVSHYYAVNIDPGFLPVPPKGERSGKNFECKKCGADRTNFEPFVHHCR